MGVCVTVWAKTLLPPLGFLSLEKRTYICNQLPSETGRQRQGLCKRRRLAWCVYANLFLLLNINYKIVYVDCQRPDGGHPCCLLIRHAMSLCSRSPWPLNVTGILKETSQGTGNQLCLLELCHRLRFPCNCNAHVHNKHILTGLIYHSE